MRRLARRSDMRAEPPGQQPQADAYRASSSTGRPGEAAAAAGTPPGKDAGPHTAELLRPQCGSRRWTCLRCRSERLRLITDRCFDGYDWTYEPELFIWHRTVPAGASRGEVMPA